MKSNEYNVMLSNPCFDAVSIKPIGQSFKKSLWIYSIVSLFLIFEMAVQVSPSVMSSSLMQDLGISAFSLGLMSGIYFYTYTSMQIPSGLLFDRITPKIIIVSSIVICSLGAIAFSFSHSLFFGCLSRLLMGIGSAFAFVSVLVVASDLFPLKYFALLTGITQALAAMGAMLGQMPISMLAEQLGWRNAMLALGLGGIVIAIISFIFINYEKMPTVKFASSSSLLTIKKSLYKIISNPQSWMIALYACLMWMPMSGFASLWGVSFLMKADGLGENTAALLCSLMWLGLAIASPLLGLVSSLLSNKRVLLITSSLLGFIAFALIVEFQWNSLFLSVLLLMAGAGCAGQALSFAVVNENNDKDVKATAIAFNNMAVVISGAIVQPLIGYLISTTHFSSKNTLTLQDYRQGLWVVLVAYIVALVTAFVLIKENKK
jgi:MFS family permease